MLQPLRTDIRQIRLLTLQPNVDRDAEPTGTLESVDLDSHPQYEAISYAWGEVNPSGQMIVDGETFKIPKNLVQALRYLRCSSKTRKLWADATCINQENKNEKTAQIKLMGQIYHGASSTLVWLGPREDENDEFVFQTLKRLSAPHPISLRQIILEEAGVWAQSQRSLDGYDFDNDDKLEDLWNSLSDEDARHHGGHVLPSLQNFFIFNWWQRFWVLEEVALVPEARLFWGEEYLTFSQVTSACDKLLTDLRQNYSTLFGIWEDSEIQDFRDELAVSVNTAQKIKIISDRIRDPAEQLPLRQMCFLIIEMLAIGRTRNAYHACDKVYGLLGLFPPALIGKFPPSYTKSTDRVFQDTAFNLLDLSQSFMLFNCIREGPHLETPSWTPDWTYQYHQLQDFNLRAQQESLFRACHNASWDLTRQLTPPVLQVTGFRLDKISRKCQPRHDLLDAATLVMFLQDCVRHADDDLLEIGHSEFDVHRHREVICSTQYITGGNVLEAVCRIAFNDCEPLAEEAGRNHDRHGRIQRLRAENFHRFYQWLVNSQHDFVYELGTNKLAEDMAFQGVAKPSMCEFARSVMSGKAFFATTLGYAGLVDDDYQDDYAGEVWILAGGSQPVILQPVPGQPGSFHVISEAYLHGVMDGEAACGKVPILSEGGRLPSTTSIYLV